MFECLATLSLFARLYVNFVSFVCLFLHLSFGCLFVWLVSWLVVFQFVINALVYFVILLSVAVFISLFQLIWFSLLQCGLS